MIIMVHDAHVAAKFINKAFQKKKLANITDIVSINTLKFKMTTY